MSYLVVELIEKKRKGFELSDDEIVFLVHGISDGSIPDYQITAWLMATYLKGLSARELKVLTREMKESGKVLEWRKLSEQFKSTHFADKHSTGGVGDKVSLVLGPLAAAMGLKVPMMSGRGLGHTGGTVDKLQSIAGFNMYPQESLMIRSLDEVGICMMAQAEGLVPADRKLYALRDVTATVDNVGLISASIVSKKWAEGAENIVFDVKVGEAAFMDTLERARELGKSLVELSKGVGLRAVALITRMDEPLGAMVGNALEVKESYDILRNKYASEVAQKRAEPLTSLCVDLSAEMALLAGLYKSFSEARQAALRCLESGAALEKFKKMLEVQGASPHWFETLPVATNTLEYRAPKAGYLSHINAKKMGLLGLKIGVGRQKTEDEIAFESGFEILALEGQKLNAGALLCRVHLPTRSNLMKISGDELRREMDELFVISDSEPARAEPLIVEKIT